MARSQHQQLTDSLLTQIVDGTIAVGDRLPTEQELCALHGLARGTVRRALGRIEELGMIIRRPGAGTVVISSSPVDRYQPLAQSAADIVTLATETRLAKPASREVTLNGAQARRLKARPGSAWFLIEGLRVPRRGDKTPLCWSEQYLRADLPRDQLIRGRFTISEVEGQKVEQTISAALIDESIAGALQANAGDAALVISRWHRHPSGRLVSIGVHTHPSDRYAITYHL